MENAAYDCIVSWPFYCKIQSKNTFTQCKMVCVTYLASVCVNEAFQRTYYDCIGINCPMLFIESATGSNRKSLTNFVKILLSLHTLVELY